ncbi:MAG: preprotein translocase subunit SecG [Crenarchaeota archaeon]|jgi:preprotein translocase subunit SecG|nr:preprotein translocase subunit SecG [Thermoproteota archaeon]
MTILVILIIIASIALGFFVLIQESKGGGLASNFASSNQIMGVRKTTDFLEKVTWGLAIGILVLCLAGAFLTKSEFGDRSGEVEQTEQTTGEEAE